MSLNEQNNEAKSLRLIDKFKQLSLIKKFFSVIGVYLLISIASGFLNTKTDSAEEFLNAEQTISEINGRWQIEGRRIEQLINDVSTGVLSDEVEVQTELNSIRSSISPILVELSGECRKLPEKVSNAEGEEAAIDGAYEMLREWCRVVPLQTLELYSVVNAQISTGSTQYDVDIHITNYQNLQRQKLEAISSGLLGFLPYLSGTDKTTAESLLTTVNEQLDSM